MLEVLSPGLLSTVQDSGRPDAIPLGVPRGGACDMRALAVANALLGNEPGAAALEMTLVGPELRVVRPCVVAIAGADLGGLVQEEARPVAPGSTYLLRAGTTLAFPGVPAGAASRAAQDGDDRPAGCRAYLAVPGGLDVPLVLGSRSTCLVGAFGGVDGRPLRAGDRLEPRRPGSLHAAGRTWPHTGHPGPAADEGTLRILPGPHVERFGPAARALLAETGWRVGRASDRMGVRLEGPARLGTPDGTRELVSLPMTWGAIQVPADGAPIALLADHQTVGGYPVIAVVIAADLPALGQLRPGDTVRFTWTTLQVAVAAARAAAAELARAMEMLMRSDPWDELAEGAEG